MGHIKHLLILLYFIFFALTYFMDKVSTLSNNKQQQQQQQQQQNTQVLELCNMLSVPQICFQDTVLLNHKQDIWISLYLIHAETKIWMIKSSSNSMNTYIYISQNMKEVSESQAF